MIDDEAIEDVVLVSQLPSNAWFEGFAMRPNGHSLVTRLDHPEIYTLDPTDPDAKPRLVHTFAGATGLTNLCPLMGRPDEYAVVSGVMDLAAVQCTDSIVWHVSLSDDSEDGKCRATVRELARLSEAGCAIGVTPFDERTLVVADAHKSCMWRVDVATGAHAVLVQHESMRVAGSEAFFGINSLRVAGGFVWFTNDSAGLLGRVPVARRHAGPKEEEGGGELRVTGPVQILAENVAHIDGLAVARDLSAVYVLHYLGGFLWKFEIDPDTGHATPHVVMQNLVNPTAVELVYVEGSPRPRIMVVCCGTIEVGWINDEDRKSWSDIADINVSVTVTVTSEAAESA